MNKSKQSLGCFVIVLSRVVLVLSRIALVLCRVVLVLCCVVLSRVLLCYYSCSFLDYIQQNRRELSVTDSMTPDAHRVNERLLRHWL